MPVQYKIEYRWDKLSGPMAAKKRNKPVGCVPPASVTERSKEQGPAAGPEGGKNPKSESGVKSHKTPGGLEKVVLPAGYCVYYARGSGRQLMQSDPHQGKINKSGQKGLGVVDRAVCNTHNVVEEEYAIIREVVEIYLEKQVSGGTDGNRYRVGGHLEDQKQLLEKLAQSLPAGQETYHVAETISVPRDARDTPKPETDPTSDDTSRPPQPAGKNSRRNILPISTALQANLSPRGPFFVKGQAVCDTGREDDNVEPEGTGAPGTVRASDPADEAEEGPLTVGKLPLSPRVEDKKEQELERRFDVIRTVFQRYSDPSTVTRKQQRRKLGGARPGRLFVPYGNIPLRLVSARSQMEVRNKVNPRSNAGMTPKETDSEDHLSGKPPSPTFQTKEKRGAGRGGVGRLEHWKPVVSRKGYDPAQRKSNHSKAMKTQQVEGRSFITRMPSKVILNVVLPREVKSREDRLCGRLSGSTFTGTGQQPLQAWLSCAPSPPPPPPPTAPDEAEAEGLAGHYVIYHDDSDDGDYADVDDDDDDDDSGVHQGRFGSSPSAGSFFDASTRSRSLNVTQAAASSRTAASTGGTDTENDENIQPEESTADKVSPATTAVPDETATAAPAFSNLTTAKPTKRASSPRAAAGVVTTTSQQASVPPLNLGRGMVTEGSKFHSSRQQGATGTGSGHQQRVADPQTTSCRRATHCDLFGPTLCADCEAAEHRRQFTARQELLYPQIDVFPRHMVATQRFRGTFLSKGDHPRGHGWSKGMSVPRWPYVSLGQLNNVVTDLDLCKRIVDKGHRAKLPTNFS